MQTLRSPLRRHIELIDDDDEDEKAMIYEKAAAIRADYDVVDGKRVGRTVDLRTVDGQVRGPKMNEEDSEPSDEGVDSGCEFKSFAKGVCSVLF